MATKTITRTIFIESASVAGLNDEVNDALAALEARYPQEDALTILSVDHQRHTTGWQYGYTVNSNVSRLESNNEQKFTYSAKVLYTVQIEN